MVKSFRLKLLSLFSVSPKEELERGIQILKWLFLAGILGGVVGGSTALFLNLLNSGIALRNTIPFYFIVLPFALALNAYLVQSFLPSDTAHTTDKIIANIHRSQPASVGSTLKAFFLPLLTIIGGGSAGKEAPCAVVGAGLGSQMAKLFKLEKADRRVMMICGVSAGFAAVFGTPIAGAIFGLEILFIGNLMYDVLLASIVSAFAGYYVSSLLGIPSFTHTISFVPVVSRDFLLIALIAGGFFGICSYLLIKTYRSMGILSRLSSIPLPVQAFLAGLVLVGLTFIVSDRYLGLGLATIFSTLQGEKIIWYAFILKIFFTSVTLRFGGSGGLVTPIFFIGAAAGAFFAQIFNLDVSTFAAIGLVSLLAGAVNAPLAAIFLAVELFGPGIAPYAAISCVVSYFITGNRSLFPSQVISIRKGLKKQPEPETLPS